MTEGKNEVQKSTGTFNLFRKVALAEGISFLVLLFIAMPLKYAADLPLATMITGGIHGLLFVGFLALAWETKNTYKKEWSWLGKAFLASIIPFGTLLMDKVWKKEELAVDGIS